MALVVAILLLFTVACGQFQQQHYEGAGAGAVVGGVAGALLDKKIHGVEVLLAQLLVLFLELQLLIFLQEVQERHIKLESLLNTEQKMEEAITKQNLQVITTIKTLIRSVERFQKKCGKMVSLLRIQ